MQPASPEDADVEFVQAARNLVHTAHSLVELFHWRVLDDFRANSRNLSSGVGLSIGLDAGPGYVVKIADELTIVGPPVVGAVRMVNAASTPREIRTFISVSACTTSRTAYEALGMAVTREFRPTKEYPRGQEVYTLTFTGPEDEAEEGDGADADEAVRRQ